MHVSFFKNEDYYRELISRIMHNKNGNKKILICKFKWGDEKQCDVTLFLRESKFLENTYGEIEEEKRNLYLRLLSGNLNENMIKEYFQNDMIMEYNDNGQRIIYSGKFTFENSTFHMENGHCCYMFNDWDDDYINIIPIDNGRRGDKFQKLPTENFYNLLNYCFQKRKTENLSEPEIC